MTENSMHDIDRRVELGLLMDFYGPMLSERIAGIMNMYVLEDYGLSEIAQEKGISRQGVYDAVRRGESQLMELEQRLGLQKRHEEMARAAQPSAAPGAQHKSASTSLPSLSRSLGKISRSSSSAQPGR